MIQAARASYLAVKNIQGITGAAPSTVATKASRMLMEGERKYHAADRQDQGPRGTHGTNEGTSRGTNDESGNPDETIDAEAKGFLSEAELVLAKANPRQPATRDHQLRPARAGTGKDPKSLAILAKLEEPIAMSFPNETPLEDVLKYIKQATPDRTTRASRSTSTLGLQEAEKTLTSPVQLDLEGIPAAPDTPAHAPAARPGLFRR